MADSSLIELLWDYLPRDREHSDRRRTSYGTKTKAGLAESVRRIVIEEPTPTGRDREIIALLWNYLPKVQEHRDRRMTGWGSKTEQGLLASVYSAVTEGSQNPTSVIPRAWTPARVRRLKSGQVQVAVTGRGRR